MEWLLNGADAKERAECVEYMSFWINSIVLHTMHRTSDELAYAVAPIAIARANASSAAAVFTVSLTPLVAGPYAIATTLRGAQTGAQQDEQRAQAAQQQQALQWPPPRPPSSPVAVACVSNNSVSPAQSKTVFGRTTMHVM